MEETFEGVFRKKDETATTDFMCGDGSRIMKASVGVECESEFFGDVSICLEPDESFFEFIYTCVKQIIYSVPENATYRIRGFYDLSIEDKYIFIDKLVGAVARKIKMDLMDKITFEANECLRAHANFMPGLVTDVIVEWATEESLRWQDLESFEKNYFNKPVGKADPFGLNK